MVGPHGEPLGVIEADRRHVWHPYASMPSTIDCIEISSAEGAVLTLATAYAGRTEVVDAMSSWWATIHGYRHPVLDAAATAQLHDMSHVMFGGLTHRPGVRLCERLVEITPGELEHVFLTDSGSVSVEVAMKMALQWQRGLGRDGRNRFLTWRGGYHGDTFLAMSVCDPVGGMHQMWSSTLPQQVFAEAPPGGFEDEPDSGYIDHLWDVARGHAAELAGIIVEPVVQGAGGMRFHSPGYLVALRDIASELDVPLVFDEIATGFGRTGRLFAADHAGVVPDIMCVGKALTGGYVSMAAALCNHRIAEGIGRGDAGVLAHGPTFMGNPLASSIALASIDLLLETDWSLQVQRIEKVLRSGLAPARALASVADVRCLGAIGVIELHHDVDVKAATSAALSAGVWIRPFRNLIYCMPPYITSDDQLRQVTSAMLAAASTG
jgi:adenosylmethionine-8-amino-7-oxononanoate aminotransferase